MKVFLSILLVVNLVYGGVNEQEDRDTETLRERQPLLANTEVSSTSSTEPSSVPGSFVGFGSTFAHHDAFHSPLALRFLGLDCEYAFGANGRWRVFFQQGFQLHFIQQPDGMVIQRSSLEMIEDLTQHVVTQDCRSEFYSCILDKLVVNVARRAELPVSSMTRIWTLQETGINSVIEGYVVVHVTGSPYDFVGKPSEPFDLGGDVQEYVLDRQQAEESLEKTIVFDPPRPGMPTEVLGRDVALFDDWGPANYWGNDWPSSSPPRASKRNAAESEGLSDSEPQAKKSKQQCDAEGERPSSSSDVCMEQTLRDRKIDASGRIESSQQVDPVLAEEHQVSSSEPQAKKSKQQCDDEGEQPSSSSDICMAQTLDLFIEQTLRVRKIDASGRVESSQQVDPVLAEEHKVSFQGQAVTKTTYMMLRDIVQSAQETGRDTFYSVVLDKVFDDITCSMWRDESVATRWQWKMHRCGNLCGGDLKDRVVIDFGGRFCLAGRSVCVTKPHNNRDLQGYRFIFSDVGREGSGTPLYYWEYDASIAPSGERLKIMKLNALGYAGYILGADSFFEEGHQIESHGEGKTKTTEDMLREAVVYAQNEGRDSFYSVVLDSIFHDIVRTEGFGESLVTRWHWRIHPCDTKVSDLKGREVMYIAGLCCLSGESFNKLDRLSNDVDDQQGYHLIFRDYERDNPKSPLYYWEIVDPKQKPLV